jgi:hypothetical protein
MEAVSQQHLTGGLLNIGQLSFEQRILGILAHDLLLFDIP